jgi:phosphate binding protein
MRQQSRERRTVLVVAGALAGLGLFTVSLLSGCGGKQPAGSSPGAAGATASQATYAPQDCSGAVKPTREAIESGEYTPLSRPLYIYVNRKALARPEVAAFVKFYLNEGQALVPEAKYVPLHQSDLEKSREALAAAVGDKEQPVPMEGAIINVDGSSTVLPISMAVAEMFAQQHPTVQVPVTSSGTGGGFKKFAAGEIDINDASRPIKPEEIAKCKENGIEYVELKVAIDGLSVVVNPKNNWCDCLSVEQLKRIWEPGSKVEKWSDLDPSWPAVKIKLYGPDTDSGTFEYFTEAICGKAKASRPDYSQSGDDNVLVQGVEGDQYSLGYFGFAYYELNQDKLKIIGIKPASKQE